MSQRDRNAEPASELRQVEQPIEGCSPPSQWQAIQDGADLMTRLLRRRLELVAIANAQIQSSPNPSAESKAGSVEAPEVLSRLDRIESLLDRLIKQGTIKECYSTEEIATLLGKAEF